MSDIETELVKTAKFKAPKVKGDRQDYLAALARACYKLDNDTFDEISEPAADWVNKAVEALNNKEDLPEFPDLEDEAQDEEVDESEEDSEAAEAVADAEEGTGEDDTEAGDSPDDDAVDEAEPEEKPKTKAKVKAAPKQEVPPPKRKNKPSKEEQAKIKTRYDDLTGEKDRYGIIIGTKTHDAVLMYERGTTSRELKERLGGRFYNILDKLEKAGHRVERSGIGTFTVVHKDDIQAKPAKPAKKGKK